MKGLIGAVAAAMLVMLAAGTARAEMYIGGSLGHAATVPAVAEDSVNWWNNSNYVPGNDCDSVGCYSEQDPSGALKFFVGYQINPWFGVEGFLSYLGSYDSYATDGWTEAYTTADIGSLGLAAVGQIPLGSGRVSLLGKLGLHSWSIDGNEQIWDYGIGDGTSGSFSETGVDFMGGVGVNINFGQHAAMRVEYEFFAAQTANTDLGIGFLSVGGMYRF
jgi:hypothetical protein